MNRILQIASILIIVSLIAVFVYVQSDSDSANRASGSIYVDVQEGSVHVSNPQGALDLKAGQKGVVAKGQKPALESLPDTTQTIRVIVVNDLHQPLANSQVAVLDENDKPVFGSISDTSGAVQLDLPPNFYGTLIAEAAEHFAYKEALVPDEPALTVTLPRRLSIAGRVSASSGKSIDGFSLWLSAPAVTLEATQPEFEFASLKPGEYLLQLRHPTLLGEDRTVQAGASVDLILQETGTLIVHMKTDQDLPVEGAALSLLAPDGGQFVSIAEMKTNEDGLASFTALRKGQYRIAQRHSWLDRFQQTPLEMNRAIEHLEIVVPQPVGVIAGRVIDASTGLPIPNAPVVLGLDQGRGIAGVRSSYFRSVVSTTETILTDENGHFEFDHLWNGRYVVFVEQMEGYMSGNLIGSSWANADTLKQVVISQEVNRADQLEFALKRCWIIQGRVYDPFGRPAANIVVKPMYTTRSRFSDFGNLMNVERTDNNGDYEVKGPVDIPHSEVVPGYFVMAFHPVYGEAVSHGPKLYFLDTLTPSPFDTIQGFYLLSNRIKSPTETGTLDLKPGDVITGADIRFTVSPIVYGTVRSEDGKPISRALVRVHPAVEMEDEKPGNRNVTPLEQYSDEYGRYRIRLQQPNMNDYYNREAQSMILSATRPYTLSVFADGYSSEIKVNTQDWFILDEIKEPLQKDFVLSHELRETLEGVVEDEQGTPLKDVKLYVTSLLAYTQDRYELIREGFKPTLTKLDGSFSIDLSRFPDLTLLPYFKDWRNMYSISIPFPDYELRDWEPEGEKFPYNTDSTKRTASFPSGQKNIRLVLKIINKDANATITGRVVDTNGNPIKNYDLMAIPSQMPNLEEGFSSYLDWVSIQTSDGSFVVKDLPKKNGPYILVARTDIYALGTSPFAAYPNPIGTEQNPPEKNPVEVEIRVGQGAQVWGTLLDAKTQNPIVNQTVNSALSIGWGGFGGDSARSGETFIPSQEFISNVMPYAVTDSTGRFVIKNLPIPSCNIRIPESNNYGEMLYALRGLKPGEKRDIGIIQLKPKR